ncbi:MAG: hypothetical protein H6Q90_4803 [Deltaproteobacteria bacterium]|nr:hypothetical protein [Deltaproteobacteria bacterium]
MRDEQVGTRDALARRMMRSSMFLILPLALATTAEADSNPPTAEHRIDQLDAQVRQLRAERAADLEYRENAIRFGDDVEVEAVPVGNAVVTTTRKQWYPYVGDVRQARLERTDFYRLVGRDDLAKRYQRRHTLAIGGLVVGAAGALAGGFLLTGSAGSSGYGTAGAVIATGGLISLGIGTYFMLRTDPVSREEARELAADYNTDLRDRLRVAPFVASSGGGVGVGGAF